MGGLGIAAIFAFGSRVLMWLVATYAGQWVLKILVTLGIGAVTTTVALPALLSAVKNHANGLSGTMYQIFGALGFDVAITLILSAVVANATGRILLRAVQA